MATCGKNNWPVCGVALSLVGGVVVIKKSPRSLKRERRPTTARPDELVEILSTPTNDCGRFGNKSLKNFATCPFAGIVSEVAVAEVPSLLKSSRLTAAGLGSAFEMATPVCIDPALPAAPDPSAYMRNAVPAIDGTPASVTVIPAGR